MGQVGQLGFVCQSEPIQIFFLYFCRKMRSYVRKADRVKAPSDVIDRAVAKVLDEEKSVSSVAILFKIPRSLTRYVENKKKLGLEEQNRPSIMFLQPIMGIHLRARF
ncbi:Uncharacterized protein APZ42_019147 [Daphnia magna]|uniref:HTH psq-type domain-containing protein n=1 Tax=Daphnia magna TaxID=35525 RepID=A0A164YJC3_9CRUS|nr:Uncharacterized protein APZ42_019147 [Daphnia magna]